MNIRPLHDRVVVRRLEEETTSAGGIVLPDSATEKPSQGEILAAGPGKATDSGDIPTDPNMKDGLLWFCDNCNTKLHETYFPLDNIEKDFLPRFKEFYHSEDLRTCKNCGEVMPVDPRFTAD